MIPKVFQKCALERIHECHLEIGKTLEDDCSILRWAHVLATVCHGSQKFKWAKKGIVLSHTHQLQPLFQEALKTAPDGSLQGTAGNQSVRAVFHPLSFNIHC